MDSLSGEGAWWNWKEPQVSLEGNHDNSVSGTHPNQSTGAWTKKGGQRTGESQDMVSAFFPFSPAIKATEKQFTTEDE